MKCGFGISYGIGQKFRYQTKTKIGVSVVQWFAAGLIYTSFPLFFSTRYNLKYVAIEAKAEKERKESESVGSSQDGHDDDLDDLNDDFAEVKYLKL